MWRTRDEEARCHSALRVAQRTPLITTPSSSMVVEAFLLALQLTKIVTTETMAIVKIKIFAIACLPVINVLKIVVFIIVIITVVVVFSTHHHL